MLPVAVSQDLLGDIEDDDPIHQLVSIAAPWLEETMNMEIQEVHPNLINFDEETLFAGKVAHNLDEIIGDLKDVIFGEFVVLFINEIESYAKHPFEKRSTTQDHAPLQIVEWIAKRKSSSLILAQIASSRLHLQVVSGSRAAGVYFTLKMVISIC
jgi:hypothetical protein